MGDLHRPSLKSPAKITYFNKCKCEMFADRPCTLLAAEKEKREKAEREAREKKQAVAPAVQRVVASSVLMRQKQVIDHLRNIRVSQTVDEIFVVLGFKPDEGELFELLKLLFHFLKDSVDGGSVERCGSLEEGG